MSLVKMSVVVGMTGSNIFDREGLNILSFLWTGGLLVICYPFVCVINTVCTV